MGNYGQVKTCTSAATTNTCNCANGTPKTGAACTANGASMCESCASGFSLNAQQTGCALNSCNCANGTPKTGAACTANGASMCESCNPGFTIDGQQTACLCLHDGDRDDCDDVDAVTNNADTVTEKTDSSNEASDVTNTDESSTTTKKSGDEAAVATDAAVPQAGALVGLCVPVILQTLF